MSKQKYLYPVLLVAVVICCFIYLSHAQEKVSVSQMIVNPGWFFLALLACLINVITGYKIWISILTKKSNVEKQSNDYFTYVVSLLSRYLPGGKIAQFLPFVGSDKVGRSPMLLSYALTFSMVTGIIAGFWIAAIGGFLKEGWQNFIFASGCLALSALSLVILSHEKLFQWVKKISPKWIPFPKFSLEFPFRDLFLFSTFQFFGAWLAEGIAIFSILSSLQISVSHSLFGELFWGYVVASVGGYLVFITPGGIGVREGIFIALLQSRIGLANAAYLAAWQRIILVLADLLFSLPAVVGLMRRISASQ
jgi:hypothetical protein